MQNISSRLAESNYITLHTLVEELYNAPDDTINVTFWSGVSLTLPHHRGSISLTSIISRLDSMYNQCKVGHLASSIYRPCQFTRKTLLLCSALEERVSKKIENASIITQIFLCIKRFFVRLWFNRHQTADLLGHLSLKIINQYLKFHITTISSIENGSYREGTRGDFLKELPVIQPDTVVIASNRGSGDFDANDSVELTSNSAIDILATSDLNIPALQEYLNKNGLTHRFSVITIDQLRQDLNKELKSFNYNDPLPRIRRKEDVDNFLVPR